ncbi:MAG: thiaminase II [Chloroflexales bacterium]|nr:thiaminase II [Chloroflexales bacterium]
MNETNFSQQAWKAITPIYARIIELPFIQELMAGTLAIDRFQFDMRQDAYYLQDFSRVLAVAAARSSDADMIVKFAEDAQRAIVVERALHGSYFTQFGITPAEVARTEASPTCFSYTHFLLATAYHAPYEALVAAVLPCFWIYWEVGKHIYAHAAPNNPYRAWIDTYAGDDFGETVQATIAAADAVGVQTSPSKRNAMLQAFVRAAQLEWMFWDSAYCRETWPVKPEL